MKGRESRQPIGQCFAQNVVNFNEGHDLTRIWNTEVDAVGVGPHNGTVKEFQTRESSSNVLGTQGAWASGGRLSYKRGRAFAKRGRDDSISSNPMRVGS